MFFFSSKLITFVKDKEELTVGLFYIFILCLTSMVETLIMQHYSHQVVLLGNELKISSMNIIYRKVIIFYIILY